jgi:hypothetical protein
LTGAAIEEGKAAQLVINYRDSRRDRVVLDVNADAVDDLARKGRREQRRGRRVQSES